MEDLPTTATLTTPPGRGGIAVIWLSGPRAEQIIQGIFKPYKSHLANLPDTLRLGHIVDGQYVLDQAIVTRAGEAFEINIHGGPLVTSQVMDLLEGHGASVKPTESRQFQPFSPAHPKWNNPAIGIEMLDAMPRVHSDLVLEALTSQWSGGLSELARAALNNSKGLPSVSHAEQLVAAADALPKFLKLLQPPEVVIAGPPNVGKSTLTNVLLGRPVSIVHDSPGTTRDYVRELAIIDGRPIYITDTAGLWSDARGVDAQAVERAHTQAGKADLVLLAGQGPLKPPDGIGSGRMIRIATKSDICKPDSRADLAVSAHTGSGLAELKRVILRALDLDEIDPIDPMAFTARQANLLRQSLNDSTKLLELLETVAG